jgi:hypothetical protein
MRTISQADYEGILSLVEKAPRTAGERRREEMKRMSDDRMAKWPDTLQAQRKRKEDAYLARLRKQEEERIALDEVEDKRLAAERQAKIDYAAKTIYRNTDKIKLLASAELLSECLYTRDKQVQLKKKIEAAEKEWEASFLLMEEAARKKDEEREQRELQKRKQVALEVAKTQKEQLAEIRQTRLAELAEIEAEGLELVKEAKAQQEEAIQEMKNKEVIARQNKIAILKANQAIKERRAEFAAMDALEDAKIKEYAENKEATRAREIAQHKKIFESKQQRRNELIERGAKRLADFTSKQNQRLENEIAQARQAEDLRMQKLADKRAAFAKTIDDSRRTQVVMRAQARDEAKQADEEHAIRWREYNKGAEMEERLEAEAQVRAARQHQQILLNQIEDKRLVDIELKRRAIFEARELADQEKVSLDDFTAVAQERIAAVKAAGMTPIPLIKCMKKVQIGRAHV